jgi:sugar/nucleoside kinase (ribokinase family)
METSVKHAMEALASGKESLDPRQALGLRDRLNQVDVMFANLRSEISRLSGLLAEQKDTNDALRANNLNMKKELDNLKSLKSNGKPPTSRKNLTRK